MSYYKWIFLQGLAAGMWRPSEYKEKVIPKVKTKVNVKERELVK
jgi:hypothetical protein